MTKEMSWGGGQYLHERDVELPTPQRRRKLRRKIEALFKASPKKTWWFSTLVEKTGADLEDVVAVCRKLMDDGKVHAKHPSRRGSRQMKTGGRR